MSVIYFLLSICLSVNNTEPIYNYTIPAATGDSIHFNDYRGKKILLVNIASGSNRIGQLIALQQLQQQYVNDLAVVVFPSNSFGNEPLSDSAIAALCHTQYETTFAIARKGAVSGVGKQDLYAWLGDDALNGVHSMEPKEDFKKYLISSSGVLIGSFAAEISPTSTLIVNAILNPNN